MKEIINKFWSRDAGSYSKYVRRILHSKREKNAWQEIFTEALGKEKLKILDVGTGPGIVAFLLTELDHDVTGVDLSEEMADIKILENLGFKDIIVREGINRGTYTFFENLKRGYWGDTFLVSGVKQ